MNLTSPEHNYRRVFFDVLRDIVEQLCFLYAMPRVSSIWPKFDRGIMAEFQKVRPIRNWVVHRRDHVLVQQMSTQDIGYTISLEWCMNGLESFQYRFTRWIEKTVSVSDIVDDLSKI